MSETKQIKKEVSCKILQTYFLACKKKGISPDKIIHNLPYSREYLENKHERIEWRYFLKITENMRAYFEIDEFENIGRLHVTPGFYPEGILAGLIFFSSNKFSRILAKRVFKIGDMMISCMKHEIEFPGKNNIIVKLYLDNNYQSCPEFFISIKGYWVELGKLVGHKNFKISLSLINQGATYIISWEKEGISYNIKKRLRWLLNIRRAFTDLTESHEKLLKQYDQLEESKRILQKQTTQLITAHDISKSIRQNIDIHKTIKEITDTLVRDAEFSFAKVIISKDIEGNNFEAESISGKQSRGSETIIRDIEIADNKIGELLIQPISTSYESETEELLNYLLPVINISIHDALVLRTITDYKNNLETKVECRTSELQNAQEELSKTVHLLKEAQQAQNRFFTNISHEFRTPLTLIMGPAENIVKQSKDSNIIEEAKLIYRSAKKINRLTNQLLDISKIESGRIKLKTSRLNLINVLNENIALFKSFAESKNISLLLSKQSDVIYIYLDREKFDKIISNVLSNALKFTPVEGYINIDIKNNVPDGNPVPDETGNSAFVEIAVSDSGIGIPGDKIDKIFNRFYQVDNNLTREYEGTGIGLSLTKELIELHKGKIIAESEEGKGSIFRIFLPKGTNHLLPEEIVTIESRPCSKNLFENEVLSAEKKENKLYSADFETNTLPLNDEKPYLLIIDDNTEVRNFIKKNLSAHFNICEAINGEDGWKISIKNMPDLIISDVMMPKMDGFELCKKLKTDERTNHIPVMMLTARATLEDKISGLEIGADDYLIKPFDSEELTVRCLNLINMRKKLREKFSREIILQPTGITITSADEKFLNRTIKIIEKEMSNPDFGVDKLSTILNMSRVQLYRKIKALTDFTASDFIRIIRLKRAKSLIEQKFGNISEIALEVGFNNPSYFSYCFRKEFGRLPSEF